MPKWISVPCHSENIQGTGALIWPEDADRFSSSQCVAKVFNENNAALVASAPYMLDLFKEILNSDMAQREEDEGNESEILNKIRIIIKEIEG